LNALSEVVLSIDIAKGRARDEMVRCAEDAKNNFAKFVQDIQKDVIERGDSNKVVVNYYEDGGDGGQEYVSFDLNPDYYIRYMQLVTKYAKPYANIINSVVGLLMSFKAAFENFGFIAKGFEEEAKKLEAELSTKKD
jgi:hypothetical protein